NRYCVDATVGVPRTASLEQVHAWSDAIEKRVGEIVPEDVVQHAEPQAPSAENLLESIRATSQRLGYAIHDLSVHRQEDKLFVELHLEVDEKLTLREAHRQATELEDAILELPEHPAEVNIHIEPMGSKIAKSSSAGEMKGLADAVQRFLNPPTSQSHD